MKNELVDERIIISKRKIQSDGFMIVWIILLVSILIQQYLDAPISQYIVEMVIWLSMSIYLLIFNFIKGNEAYPTNNKRNNLVIIMQSIFTGLVIAITNTIQNYFNYSNVADETIVKHVISVAIVSFISGTVTVFVGLKLIVFFYASRRSNVAPLLEPLNIRLPL